jgi:uncharacterized protein (DUF302 family)
MKHSITTLLISALFSFTLQAQEPITHVSKLSFSETVESLKKTIEQMDLQIIAEINHTQGAEKAGLHLAPTHVLIFGNPKVGTLLMQEDRGVALDLPLRMLIYEKEERTYISYHDPKSLSNVYQIVENARVLGKMNAVLANISKTVAIE